MATPIAPAAATPVVQAQTETQMSAFDATLRSLQSAAPDAAAAAFANPAALGARVVEGLHGFQLRSAEMQALTQRVTTADPTTASSPLPKTFGLIVETFNFAMQTQLVARAATQFTGSVGTLMRGQ